MFTLLLAINLYLTLGILATILSERIHPVQKVDRSEFYFIMIFTWPVGVWFMIFPAFIVYLSGVEK